MYPTTTIASGPSSENFVEILRDNAFGKIHSFPFFRGILQMVMWERKLQVRKNISSTCEDPEGCEQSEERCDLAARASRQDGAGLTMQSKHDRLARRSSGARGTSEHHSTVSL
jgi:hypothetical protein